MKNLDLSLYLVTDHRIHWKDCLRSVQLAIQGGVSIVQLRDKQKSPDEVRVRAYELIRILEPMKIPLIINDYVGIAREVGAQGVHLGKEDCDVKEAREILGSDAIIGVSVESIMDFERCDWEDCNYVSASPVFPTSTKTDAAKPLGIEQLSKLRAACSIPLIAIGGINLKNAELLGSTGIDGISTVSSILCSSDPKVSARVLRERFESGRRRRHNG